MDRKEERLRRYVHILRLLAEADTHLNKNGIWLQLKPKGLGSEPTVLYAIDDLEKWGMIKLVKTKKIVPGGKTFNYYKLTRTGIENLISAGILSTKSITVTTAKLLLQKYRELLPYAAEISNLWPLFVEAKVEDIAMKRLAMFIAHFHGEQLHYHVRDRDARPFMGLHALSNLRPADLAEKIGNLSLNCTADDDVEAFLDPSPEFYSIYVSFSYEKGKTEEEIAKWHALVINSEKIQAIVVRAALKEALADMRSSNGTLKHLGVKSITLRDRDAETYGKLVAEIDFLRSRIVTPSS